MASVVHRPNGIIWIQFRLLKTRKTIRLGKLKKPEIAEFKSKIERIADCINHGQPIDPETLNWMDSRPQEIRDKFYRAGLMEFAVVIATVGELVAYCRRMWAINEPGTITQQEQVFDNALTFFSASKSLASVSISDAKEFRQWLETKANKQTKASLANTTASRRAKRTKQMFELAVEKRWIRTNPFKNMKGWVDVNPERQFYIEPDVANEILKTIDSVEFKLIFALGRWGGLRLPSEGRELKWTDIHWDRDVFTVFSPKLKRYELKKTREVPIFHQLRPYLDAAWETAEERCTDYVCPYLRSHTGQAYTNQMKKVVKRCGYDAWPKFLINLRASRSTEVLAEFGTKCEEDWIGHGADIALKHYAMVREVDIQRAVSEPQKGEVKSEAKSVRRSKKRSKK